MARMEEVKVGLFVLAALVLVALAMIFVGGMNLLQRPMNAYTMRTKFAGGVEAGAPVRYAGTKVGKVTGTALDANDPSRVVIHLNVEPSTPVRTDSKAKVSSLGLLGEYYIEIAPGTQQAAALKPGSEIPAEESIQWNELVNQFGGATDEAKAMLAESRPRVRQALDNINDLTNEENRRRLRDTLKKMDQILTDARPRLKTILANFDSSSAKIDKFMDEIKETRANLDKVLTNWNHLTEGEDADVQRTLRELRKSLARAEQTMDEVRRLLVANREHLDVTLENMEVSSENIREITDTIKQQPSSLVWTHTSKDRNPGDPGKKK